MVDPASAGAAVAGVASATGAEALKVTSGLLTRVLGPSADEIGEAMRRYTAFRVRNVGRISEAADRKAAQSDRSGTVPPRIAHRLIEEGSYCDDELMAEYLGGVLAGSRTPSGRDDRAVSWSNLVTGMSALQIRAHYLFYREWAIRLRGRVDLVLADKITTGMVVQLNDFAVTLAPETESDDDMAAAFVSHALHGLFRLGLLELVAPATPTSITHVLHTDAGIELYGWALGHPNLRKPAFYEEGPTIDTEFPIPRLRSAEMPDAHRWRPDDGTQEA